MCQALHHILVLMMCELTLCCECEPAWSATDAIYMQLCLEILAA